MMDALVLLLVVLPPVDWLAAFMLVRYSRRFPDVTSLRERAVAAIVLALVASIAGLLAWAKIGLVDIDSSVALELLAIALVVVSVPAIWWLALLLTGQFGREP